MFSSPPGPGALSWAVPHIPSPLPAFPSPVSKQDLLDPPHTLLNMQIQWCPWPRICSRTELHAFLTHSPKSLYSTARPPNPAPSSSPSQVFPQSL